MISSPIEEDWTQWVRFTPSPTRSPGIVVPAERCGSKKSSLDIPSHAIDQGCLTESPDTISQGTSSTISAREANPSPTTTTSKKGTSDQRSPIKRPRLSRFKTESRQVFNSSIEQDRVQSELPKLAPKGLALADPTRAPIPDLFVYETFPCVASRPRAVYTKRKLHGTELEGYQVNRKAGSCSWCFLRKTKCPAGSHCPQCRKQKIPAELCCRTRLKDLGTYQQRGLARAFVDTYQESIHSWDGTSFSIDIWHGFGHHITVTVHGYRPKKKIVDLFWKQPNGWQKLEHRPFGLNNTSDMKRNGLDSYVQGTIPMLLKQLRDRNTKSSAFFVSVMGISVAHSTQFSPSLNKILTNTLHLWGYTFLQYHALWRATDEGDSTSKLGMRQLVLHSHDVETLTPFDGTIPLPRLLHQQIHACIEGIMWLLNKTIVSELNRELTRFRSEVDQSQRLHHALGLYLSTWVYLSVLEEVQWDAGRWRNLLDVSKSFSLQHNILFMIAHRHGRNSNGLLNRHRLSPKRCAAIMRTRS